MRTVDNTPGRSIRIALDRAPSTDPQDAHVITEVSEAALRVAGDYEDIAVTAWDWSDLRELAAVLTSAARTSSLTVEVLHWQPPVAGWTGRLGPVPGLAGSSFRLEGDGAAVEWRTQAPQDLANSLIAALRAFIPHRVRHGSATPDVQVRPTGRHAGAWTYPTTQQRATSGDPLNPHIRSADAIVTTDHDLASRSVDAPAILFVADGAAHDLADDGTRQPVPSDVDPLIHHPFGRLTSDSPATLSLDELMTRVPGRLRLRDVRALADVDRISVPGSIASLKDDAVATLIQASASGLIVDAPAGGLADPRVVDELLGLWREAPATTAPPFDRTVASVQQRRAAHRHHSVTSRIGELDVLASAASPAPSISILLMTMRPETLPEMLRQIATFDYPSVEVIVGLHVDTDYSLALEPLLETTPLDVTVVTVPRSVPFGAALGRITAVAQGDLVTKMDDDDYYGPAHLWDLVIAHRYSGAMLVGKPAEYVYLEPLDLTVRREGHRGERCSETLAGGTMLMSRGDLESVGGWRPVPRSVDRGVIERVLREGGLVYRTHGLGYLYVRNGDGHTWDPGLGYFLRGNDEQWAGLLRHPEFGTGP